MPPRGHNKSAAQRDTEDTRHRHCAPRTTSLSLFLFLRLPRRTDYTLCYRRAVADLPFTKNLSYTYIIRKREKERERRAIPRSMRDEVTLLIVTLNNIKAIKASSIKVLIMIEFFK